MPGNVDLALIDIPIGLRDSGAQPRWCEHEARKCLGKRRSSVFTPPVRSSLSFDSYAAASNNNLGRSGKKLSKQAWGIMPKIAEVDAFLESEFAACGVLRESHPEVLFYKLNGNQPMAYAKKNPRPPRCRALHREPVGTARTRPALIGKNGVRVPFRDWRCRRAAYRVVFGDAHNPRASRGEGRDSLGGHTTHDGCSFAELNTRSGRNDRGDGRDNATPFTDRHVAILETFAIQALIAIDNARLFNELQARNEEITEALRREEASGDILRLISNSPEDLATTLQAIPTAAQRLTGMTTGLLLIEGDQAIVRGFAVTPGNDDVMHREIGQPSLINHGELSQSRAPLVRNWNDLSDDGRERLQALGARSYALVPIWRGDTLLGFLSTWSTRESIRSEAITLLQSFADQAAIAIENARLIRELRDSNREVGEAGSTFTITLPMECVQIERAS